MAMWQQQMQLMESFHNDMILMVQMFVAMHREHVASVRHELDMVQQLTGELSELQAKLADGSATPGVGLTDRTGRPAQARGSDHAKNRKKRDKKSVSRDSANPIHRPEPTSARPAESPSLPNSRSRSAERSISATSGGAGEAEGSQIHAVLTERIAELQRERQGYWQRILTVLHG